MTMAEHDYTKTLYCRKELNLPRRLPQKEYIALLERESLTKGRDLHILMRALRRELTYVHFLGDKDPGYRAHARRIEQVLKRVGGFYP